MPLRILFLADVVATPGREAVERLLPGLREELDIDLCVVNGENAAAGHGITGRIADKLLAAGADVITLGNHTWRQRGFEDYLATAERVIRPANYLESAPGRGSIVVEARDGTRVAVLNLLGLLFMEPARSPFDGIVWTCERLKEEAPVVLVDFHAEATSEKVALARLLRGRVTAVLGTHTHVQTNDPEVHDGTASLTDCGMCGPHDSVIGMRADLVLRRFLTQRPVRFEAAEADVRLEGALIECDRDTGRALSIQTFRRQA